MTRRPQSRAGQNLNEPRNRSVLRRCVAVQIDLDLINIAPSPAFRRIVALNDRMSGSVKMLPRVLPGGVIATANVTALPTDPQMHPRASAFKALLAASCAGLDLHDAADVRAFGAHEGVILSQERDRGNTTKVTDGLLRTLSALLGKRLDFSSG